MALKVALPLSLTGRFSPLAKKARDGIVLWAEYSGSQALIEDDESSPRKAAEITGKFCDDKTVHAVLGPYSSSLAVAATQSALLKKRTVWNHGGASDEACGYSNAVSSITPASRYFLPVVDMLARLGKRKAVIANIADGGFSKAVADGAERYAGKSGIKIRRIEYSQAADMSTVRDAVNPETALLSVGRMEDDIALAKTILAMKRKPDFLCFVAAGVDEFGERFGDRCENVYSVSQWEEHNPSLAHPDYGISSAEFAGMFQRRYGHAPDYPAAQAFNIGLIIQKCAEEAGTTDDTRMRDAALRLDFTTFYGRFKTDASGKQTGHKMVVTKWRDGKRVVVEPMGFEPTTSTLPVLRSPN